MSRTAAVLGVDVGTSGCRVVAFALDGRLLAAASRAYRVERPEPGRAEQDVDEIWAALEECLLDVNASLAAGGVVARALALAVQGEAIVPVGAGGRALAPMPLSFDRRAAGEATAIGAALGSERLRDRTGQPVHPMSSIFKIAWWRRHAPEIAARTRTFACLGELAAIRLGLPATVDLTIAARTGALDVRARAWDAEVLAAAGVSSDVLARPVAPGTAIGRVDAAVARRLGFPEPPLLVAGAHDQAASLWGTGAGPGLASLSLGTSECLTASTREAPERLATTACSLCPYDDEGGYVVLAGIPAGGSMLDWYAREVAGDAAGGSSIYAAMADDAGGVLVLPHLAGSGTFDNDPDSTGAIVGLTLETTRGQIARALVEASGLEVARNLDAWDAAGIAVTEVRVGGGGARALNGLAARADVIGRPLALPVGAEDATCRGAGLLAAVGLGALPSLGAAVAGVAVERRFAPDPRRAAASALLRERYARLHPALRHVREG